MERDRKRNGNDDMSIYEMMRAIGHPIDLLGNPLNTIWYLRNK
jgi:hypothetical protein